ncbi:MAG: hypothetical protein EBW35_09310, partial [Rhodobacterales bacterium]|nr:hypothetical protein [Rhodobacterales bacterium]
MRIITSTKIVKKEKSFVDFLIHNLTHEYHHFTNQLIELLDKAAYVEEFRLPSVQRLNIRNRSSLDHC